MFSLGARAPKRVSSLPMRRKDKERAKLERLAMRNKQNTSTNVSQSKFMNTLKEEILYLEEKITIQKDSLTIMESQLKQKYEELKGIINTNNLKQEMQKEQIAKNNVLDSVKNDLLNETITSDKIATEEEEVVVAAEDGDSGSQPREDGDSESQLREEVEEAAIGAGLSSWLMTAAVQKNAEAATEEVVADVVAEDDGDSGSQPREEVVAADDGDSGPQPREEGDSGSQPREDGDSGSQPREEVELIVEEKKTEKSKRKNKRSKKVTQEYNEPEQLMF